MSRFGAAANKFKDSPLVIPLFLVFISMFVVSIVTSYEDYTTSRLGYMALPTRKASMLVVYAVALIPQIGQIGFSYAWGREWKVNRKLAMISLATAIGLHTVDVFTDMVFKASGQGPEIWVLAFIESEILYTLGSEVMLVVSFGMITQLFPEFIMQLQRIASRLGEVLEEIDGEKEDDDGFGDLGKFGDIGVPDLGVSFDDLD